MTGPEELEQADDDACDTCGGDDRWCPECGPVSADDARGIDTWREKYE